MKKILLLISFCFVFTSVKAQFSNAKFYLDKAQQFMDMGDYQSALDKLNEGYAQSSNQNNIDIIYGIANCYYRLKEYNKAIDYAQRTINRIPNKIEAYRMIGNSYDLMGNYEQAIQYFTRNTARFPYEGELYFDMGVIEYLRNNPKQALKYWEEGIKAEPYFADNYYWASKIYATTNEKIYSLIYSEIFLNIEKNTERTAEIAILLRDTYLNYFKEKLEGYSMVDVFIDRNADNESNDFYDAYERVVGQMQINGSFNQFLLSGKVMENGKTTYLEKIASFRKEFLFLWTQMYANIKMPLFEWQADLEKGGYLTTYTYWLMMSAEPEFFVDWSMKSRASYDNFLMWYNRTPLKIDVINRFSRLDYVRKYLPTVQPMKKDTLNTNTIKSTPQPVIEGN